MKGVIDASALSAVSNMFGASFKNRMISGFTLGPLVLAIILYGGWPFKILAALSFGIAVKEWVGLARLSKHLVRDSILGISYIALCFLAIMKLRLDFDQGMFFAFILCIGVCASDVSAYFAGKMIGGPKLAEKISPNKTWAGLVGGMIGSAIALALLNHFAAFFGGLVGREFTSFTTLGRALVIGASFTIVGQIGDLLISSYKRKVGVKDTGDLIPGHGGILDRIDALLLVSLFFLVVLTELTS